MELESSFVCAYCLQVNEILVDTSAGRTQHYTEDCQICCLPNMLHVEIDEELEDVTVNAEPG